jgi:hypothetical protein
MQDVQNVPNPDVNSTVRDDDFGNHSNIRQETPNSDVEQPKGDIPVPPDQEPSAPIEESPADDDMEERKIIA